MKRFGITLLLILISIFSRAQDSSEVMREYVLYSGFVNVVPDNFNFPLLGFVNVAKGRFNGAEIGFVNLNVKDLNGAQIGFVNTNLANTSGAQIGYVNTSLEETDGIQIGFVNTSLKRTDGIQLGFVNTTKSMKGVQLGFVNFADTLESGVPIGFISFVRRGGYQSLEVSINEMYPYNVSFKTGIRKLYSVFEGSFNPQLDTRFALGAGLGALFPIAERLYINPEVISKSSLGSGNNDQIVNLVVQLNYDITEKLQVSGGPSLTWQYKFGQGELNEPLFSLFTNELNNDNQLVLGAKLGIRYNFSGITR